MDLAAEFLLDVLAGAGSDLPHLEAVLADQNAFLRVGLDPEFGFDQPEAVLALVDVGDPDFDLMRDLVTGADQGLTADQFGQ